MNPVIARTTKSAGILALLVSAVISSPATSGASSSPLKVTTLVSGAKLHHSYFSAGSKTAKSEILSNPDDVTMYGSDIFAVFGNGVGGKGQASPDGNRDSTIVELTTSGRVLGQWDVLGHTDGITADTNLGGVLATVNEDGSPSLYLLKVAGSSAAHSITKYSYNEVLPHLGGTDAIVAEGSRIFVSASSPGMSGKAAPQPTYPAAYSVSFASSKMLKASPLFYGESMATNVTVGSATYGKSEKLALTDPDSNTLVPSTSAHFAGDFLLDSQGDQRQIYVSGAGTSAQKLSVLALSQAVDDTVFPSGSTTHLVAPDSTNNAIDLVSGSFNSSMALAVASPCDAGSAPSTCPGPGYPANYLATLNLRTGVLTKIPVTGPKFEPAGGLVAF